MNVIYTVSNVHNYYVNIIVCLFVGWQGCEISDIKVGAEILKVCHCYCIN